MENNDETARLIPEETYCSCVKEERRVGHGSKLDAGDHITHPVNFWLCLFCLSHHAIVESQTQERVTLLHFTKDGCCKKKAKEESIDADFKNRDVFKIVYENPRNKDDIVKHAKSLIQQQNCYCVCLNNCEHFCKECVTEKGVSSQTMEFFKWCTFVIVVLILRPIRVASVFSSTMPDHFNRLFHFRIDDTVLLRVEIVTFLIYVLIALIAFIVSCCEKKNKKNACCRKKFKKCRCEFILRMIFVAFVLAEIIILDKGHVELTIETVLSVISLIYGIGLEIWFSCSARCRLRWIRPCMCCTFCDRCVELCSIPMYV